MHTKDFTVTFPYVHPPGFGHTQSPMDSFLLSPSLSIPFPVLFSSRDWIQSRIPSHEAVSLDSQSFGASMCCLCSWACVHMCTRARGKKSLQPPQPFVFRTNQIVQKSTCHQVNLLSSDKQTAWDNQPGLQPRTYLPLAAALALVSFCFFLLTIFLCAVFFILIMVSTVIIF